MHILKTSLALCLVLALPSTVSAKGKKRGNPPAPAPAPAPAPVPAPVPVPAPAPVPVPVTPAAPVTASVRDELAKNNIIPDVIDDFPPSIDLTVKYGNLLVTPGLQVAPPDAVAAPSVSFAGRAGKQYTLVMTDPGVLNSNSAHAPNAWQWLHWIVADIPSSGDLSKGLLVEPYSGPNPPQGNHRYVILLFEQAADISPATNPPRGAWNTRAFTSNYSLSTAGATFYMSQNAPAPTRLRHA